MNETLEKKTGYKWCFDANIRILNLSDWSVGAGFDSSEDSYFLEKIDASEFNLRIEKCTVKPNSQPRKTKRYLEYRMYGLVPYNISEIQKGIQFGHAVVRYGRTLRKFDEFEDLLEIYDKYADNDETFIILNGGTTNKSETYTGTMNIHLKTLKDNGIFVQDFYEPDLGDQLTAICFLVDERVFDKLMYPDFIPETLPWNIKKPSQKTIDDLENRNLVNYAKWVEKIGGDKNVFLREFLKPFKLA